MVQIVFDMVPWTGWSSAINLVRGSQVLLHALTCLHIPEEKLDVILVLVVVIILTVDGVIQQNSCKIVVLSPDELTKLDVIPLQDKLDKALIHDKARALNNGLDVFHGWSDDRREKVG